MYIFESSRNNRHALLNFVEYRLDALHDCGKRADVDSEEAVEGRVEVGEDVAEHAHREDGHLAHGQLDASRLRVHQHDSDQNQTAQHFQEKPPESLTRQPPRTARHACTGAWLLETSHFMGAMRACKTPTRSQQMLLSCRTYRNILSARMRFRLNLVCACVDASRRTSMMFQMTTANRHERS